VSNQKVASLLGHPVDRLFTAKEVCFK